MMRSRTVAAGAVARFLCHTQSSYRAAENQVPIVAAGAVQSLISLLASTSVDVQRQAAEVLRNLARNGTCAGWHSILVVVMCVRACAFGRREQARDGGRWRRAPAHRAARVAVARRSDDGLGRAEQPRLGQRYVPLCPEPACMPIPPPWCAFRSREHCHDHRCRRRAATRRSAVVAVA
jgi:hypothetical protein